jgi:hypothetical protein
MFNETDRINIKELKLGLRAKIDNEFESLKLKFTEWDEIGDLKKWIVGNCVVSGGLSARHWHGDAGGDIDWYYSGPDYAAFAIAIDTLFVLPQAKFHKFVKNIDPKYQVADSNGKVITANAVTLVNDMQIIRLDTVDKCRQLFDFQHCLPVYDYKNEIYRISYSQFDSIKYRRLIPNRGGTITRHRLDKFKKLGWVADGIVI